MKSQIAYEDKEYLVLVLAELESSDTYYTAESIQVLRKGFESLPIAEGYHSDWANVASRLAHALVEHDPQVAREQMEDECYRCRKCHTVIEVPVPVSNRDQPLACPYCAARGDPWAAMDRVVGEIPSVKGVLA